MYSSNSIRPCSSRQMLHGHLKLRVIEAKDLPDMEGRLSKLFNKKDVTDPFVDITLGSAKLAKTKMILNSLCPVWDETFRIELCHFVSYFLGDNRHLDDYHPDENSVGFGFN